ncbi:MAG: AAA family ATPase [Prevotella sp.]|nr:AAA family ATPase [Prevotella sp.]
MKETSFAKNVTTNGSSTPDFTQDIGQTKSYYMDYAGFNDICVAMLYYQVYDFDKITAPLGKGGRRQSLDDMENYSLELASIFDNIYVNSIHLVGQKLIMFIVKEERETHHNRRQLKFSKDAKYNNLNINSECIDAITSALGCSDSGSWIVTDMNIGRETNSFPRLDLTAVVVDKDNSRNFRSAEERSKFLNKCKQIVAKGSNVYNSYTPIKDYINEQKIYFGTPGSGKSWTIKKEYEMIKQGENYVYDEEKTKRVIRTTFHPDTDYASFVGCYKPIKDEEDEKKIVYEFVPQAFTDAYIAAWSDLEHPYYLIIEEINRGNCAQIFGDLFQLLDRNKDGYSEYPIKADHDLRDYLEEKLPDDSEGIKDGKLCLPPNLSLIASMNTSDQSLFPMDSAFKRRWSWEYVPIDYNNEKSGAFTITIDGEEHNWHEFLKAVNEKIKAVTSSEDKQMGNFFIKNNINEKEFCDKVMFYLWSEVGKDNYKTNDAIFRYYAEEDKPKEFSFNELYEQSKRTEILKGFIRYIEEEMKV